MNGCVHDLIDSLQIIHATTPPGITGFSLQVMYTPGRCVASSCLLAYQVRDVCDGGDVRVDVQARLLQVVVLVEVQAWWVATRGGAG